MKEYSLILLSGGKGTRFKQSKPKQYLLFAGKPMIVHTLEKIEQINEIKEVVVVCESLYEEIICNYVSVYALSKKIIFASSGVTRQESVYNGLKKAAYDNVIIHEAARPLVQVNDYQNIINCPHDNVTFTYSIPYTVLKKNSENIVSEVLNRSELINIQLPQKFKKKELIIAHQNAIKLDKLFTEDASLLVSCSNTNVYCLEGQSYNIKMTEYVDLLYGEMIIREDMIKG